MKIIHTEEPVKPAELKAFLQQKLNPAFERHRRMAMNFEIVQNDDTIEILKPDLYEGFLFRIEIINGTELHVTKSEHYTDDVNELTLEEILNELFFEYPGRDNIDYIGDRS